MPYNFLKPFMFWPLSDMNRLERTPASYIVQKISIDNSFRKYCAPQYLSITPCLQYFRNSTAQSLTSFRNCDLGKLILIFVSA